jgi:hypothetical protein
MVHESKVEAFQALEDKEAKVAYLKAASRHERVALKAGLEAKVQSINEQLETAERNAKATGVPVNPDWKQRAEYARKMTLWDVRLVDAEFLRRKHLRAKAATKAKKGRRSRNGAALALAEHLLRQAAPDEETFQAWQGDIRAVQCGDVHVSELVPDALPPGAAPE